MSEPWPEDAVRDRLVGEWHIYQRTGGHRTSTDDVVTAWHACRNWSSPPKSYLDLGSGVGSVLLTVTHRLRPAAAVGVEAQVQSVLLARRAIAELPTEAPPILIEQGDFRSVDFGDRSFELITGSPPYFPLGTGVHPEDPQRLACRFETRGGVEDYCRTAARLLSDGGRFHLVFQTKWTDRVERAGRAAGLHLVARCDLYSRSDRPQPFLTVYEFRAAPAPLTVQTLSVRDTNNRITEAYSELRREVGLDD